MLPLLGGLAMREADRIKPKNISGYSYQREQEEYEQFLNERKAMGPTAAAQIRGFFLAIWKRLFTK